MNALRAILVIALLAVPCFGQGIPDDRPEKPQPRTADAAYWTEVGMLAAAWTMDTVSTEKEFAADPAHHEAGLLFRGSRSTAKVMGAWAAVDVATAVVSYEWKKHVRNRYLHPLWHVFILQQVEGHSVAAAGNWGNFDAGMGDVLHSSGSGVAVPCAAAVPHSRNFAHCARFGTR